MSMVKKHLTVAPDPLLRAARPWSSGYEGRCETCYQRSDGGTGIATRGRPHDCDPGCPCRHDTGERCTVDASDREPWAPLGALVSAGRRVSHDLEPRGRPAQLGRRGHEWANAQVVGLGRARVELLVGVGRKPDEHVSPGYLTRPHGWKIVLTEVDAVRSCSHRHVRPIVHDEQRAVPVGSRAEVLRPAQQITRLRILLAQLDDVSAGFEHSAQEGREIRLLLAGPGDHVQTGSRQALPPPVTRTRHRRGVSPAWDGGPGRRCPPMMWTPPRRGAGECV